MQPSGWLLVPILLSLLLPAAAPAHPVAQGMLEVAVESDAIEVRLQASNEEVFVAATFAAPAATGGGPAPTAPPTLESLWQAHAAYVLAHLHVHADGVALAGELRSISPPEDRTTRGLVGYDLRFPLPAGNGRPMRVAIEQDLLREIAFAPGNPWEATFVARLVLEGRVVAEGVLFAAAQPIDWSLDWNGSTATAPAPLSHRRLVREYLEHGIRHILGGWDHLLFVAALVLGVGRVFDLVAVVSAFTLAHTVTLTLATLRLANLPSAIVEPMIALSIVAAAAQNLFRTERTRDSARLGVAFGFGLFHGLGFAGGLLVAMGRLPSAGIATAIAAFSVGVEIGHQLVAVPLFLGIAALRRRDARAASAPQLAPRARFAASLVVLVAGLYYLSRALR